MGRIGTQLSYRTSDREVGWMAASGWSDMG